MRYFAILFLALVTSLALGQNITATGDITTSWTAPTTNTDGTPLLDLAGFKVKWGMDNGCTSFPNQVDINDPFASGNTQSFTITRSTTFCFVVTAYDEGGLESENSNTAQKTLTFNVDFPPSPPTNFQLNMQFTCVTDEVGINCEAIVQ